MSRFRSDDAPALIRAADYRPSVPLTAHADEIRERARTHGLGDFRVFGSEVRGEDGFDSDIDLVVTPSAEIDLFDLALFVREVEELTGLPTDAVSMRRCPPYWNASAGGNGRTRLAPGPMISASALRPSRGDPPPRPSERVPRGPDDG